MWRILRRITFWYSSCFKIAKTTLMRTKELSYHSTDQRIIGKIFKNEYCVVVEEVIASGRSTLDVIKDIENTGMRVRDVYVIIDLEQGAVENLGKMGYKVHSMLRISQFATILCDEKLITADRCNNIIKGYSYKFAQNGDCITNTNLGSRKSLTYEQRLDACKSEIGKKLLKLMSEKKSNLCVEFIDQNMDTVLQAAELIGSYICILSVHCNALGNVEESKWKELVQISKKHKFFLMDDNKSSEDHTDVLTAQCRYRFKYVDFLTIYAICGENTLLSTKSVIENEFPEKGVFVIACPNIANAVIGSDYEKSSIEMTIKYFEEVTGFISNKNSEIPFGYVHMRSDLKNLQPDVESLKNDSFYSCKIIVDDIGADIVQLHYNGLENIDMLVKKEQLSLWDSYIKRSGL